MHNPEGWGNVERLRTTITKGSGCVMYVFGVNNTSVLSDWMGIGPSKMLFYMELHME